MKIEDLKLIIKQRIKEIEGQKELEFESNKLKEIYEIVEKEPGIFFKINMNKSLEILKYIFESDKIINIYTDLISQENFFEMKKKFEI